MKTTLAILVIEDDERTTVFLRDTLEFSGYNVITSRNATDGLELARKARPNLIVLDIMLPEIDGYETCRRLKGDPLTHHIPILMLTALSQVSDKVKGFEAGADDYLIKPYAESELQARVKALLRRSTAPSFPEEDQCNFSLNINPDQLITIRGTGAYTVRYTSSGVLALDADTYSKLGDEARFGNWRFNTKVCGEQLYSKIFGEHSDIHLHYKRGLGEVREDANFHVLFENHRDHLRLPLEFLFDDKSRESYLVLRHPLIRSIRNIELNRKGLSPSFFRHLWEKRITLKVLLLASNTGPPDLPEVDREVLLLEEVLNNVFDGKGIGVEVHRVPTEQATYSKVRQILERCDYHIIHYAGHGTYDAQSPEKSSLHFWEKENRRGRVKGMTGSEIQILLGGSNVRFVYLSCCYGTTTASRTQLLDDDFLGIADSVVFSGVPGVLGFRWPVSDSGASLLSREFYGSLAHSGQIDAALLRARRAVAASNRDDNTWLSPIMILQE